MSGLARDCDTTTADKCKGSCNTNVKFFRYLAQNNPSCKCLANFTQVRCEQISVSA